MDPQWLDWWLTKTTQHTESSDRLGKIRKFGLVAPAADIWRIDWRRGYSLSIVLYNGCHDDQPMWSKENTASSVFVLLYQLCVEFVHLRRSSTPIETSNPTRGRSMSSSFSTMTNRPRIFEMIKLPLFFTNTTWYQWANIQRLLFWEQSQMLASCQQFKESLFYIMFVRLLWKWRHNKRMFRLTRKRTRVQFS